MMFKLQGGKSIWVGFTALHISVIVFMETIEHNIVACLLKSMHNCL